MKVQIHPLKALQPLWKSKKRYKIAHGGRGSGKSFTFAERFLTFGLQERCRLLCTREVQNSIEESSLAIMKRVIRHHGLDSLFTQNKHGLACANGSEYIFRGLQYPDRIASLDGIKYCWVEEAKTVKQEAWDILIPTIREDDSEIWVSFNPENETDPVYKKFVTENRDDAEVVEINYWDNPHFPTSLKSEMEWDKAHDYEKYLWVWEGKCRALSDSLVFLGKFVVEDFVTRDDAQFYFGGDYGFAQDPSTLIRMYVHDATLYIDHEAYGIGVEIDDLPMFYRSVPGADKWRIKADSSRPDTISYLKRHGFNIIGSDKGANSIEEGIQFLRSFKKIVIHTRCKHVQDEFKTYRYKLDRLTQAVLPIVEDKNNHCIDAIRYAVEDLHGLEPRIRSL